MGSYTQWRDRVDQVGEVKRVTWVCGAEPVLVEEVVDVVRRTLNVLEVDYAAFVAGSVAEREVWAAANQYPAGSNRRLIVVREAQRVKKWAPLLDWLSNARFLPNNYLLFVSADNDLYVTDQYGKQTKPKKLNPPLEEIKGAVSLVRCSTPSESDQIKWVRRHVDAPDAVATYLLERVGGNLSMAMNVCRKAQLFGASLTRQAVDVLASEAPSDDFVESLTRLEKPRAYSALEGLSDRDYGKAVGMLDYNLDVMALLYQALRERKTAAEIASQNGAPPRFVVSRLLSFAQHYDLNRRTRCRQALAMVDDALRSGAREGPLEALVAMW